MIKADWAKSYDTYQIRNLKAGIYYQHAVKVSKEFRDLVRSKYPQLDEQPKLDTGENADFYWRLMQHILFSNYNDAHQQNQYDEWGEDDWWGDIDKSSIVCPHIVVASIVGQQPYGGNFRSGDWLRDFSENVLNLGPHFGEWDLNSKSARVLTPIIDSTILQALKVELQSRNKKVTVFFHDGKVANDANIRIENNERLKAMREWNEAIPPNHPAREVLSHLNYEGEVKKGQTKYKSLLKKNWPLVQQAADELQQSGALNDEKIEWLLRTLAHIEGFWNIYYKWVESSPRIYAGGESIHLLPSRLRKIALAGSWEMDLKACQLAVVASKWEIPSILEALNKNLSRNKRKPFTESQSDIWHELLEYVDLENEKERYKPILKQTVYSIIFGMSKRNVMGRLNEGSYYKVERFNPITKRFYREITKAQKNEGIGLEKAKALINHPYIEDLFSAREKKKREVQLNGGLKDAFGRELKLEGEKAARSLLAYVVQSYELKIMLAAFDVIKKNDRIYLHSFLHDGMALEFGNESKRVGEIKNIQAAVNQAAKDENIPTELEVKRLNPPTTFINKRTISKWLEEEAKLFD
jgi:hypothetical protein